MLKLFAILGIVALFSVAGHASSPVPPSVRIALVSDTHTTRGTQEDQALYKGHLDETISAVNGVGVNVVVIAGDLTQGGKPEEMTDFQSQITGFRAPVLRVAGNHDVGNKKIPGSDGGVTAERVARYEAVFGPSFWVKSVSGVRLIGINASLLGSGLPRETDQWTFLERLLSRPSTQPTLLVMHYPPFLQTPDEPGGTYWNIEPAPRRRLLALIKSGGVRAVLSGHLHRPLTNHLDGVLYLTTPPVSFGLPRGKQPEGWTLVTISPKTGVIQSEFHPIPHLGGGGAAQNGQRAGSG